MVVVLAQMGYADRDYIRESSTRPPSRLAGAPVVKWLLILNIGIFFIDVLFDLRFADWGAYTVSALAKGQVWRLLTFQFLHGNFGHLLFNSIAIYFFGAFVEQELKSRGFLVFYLLCGVAGAGTYSLLVLSLDWPSAGVVGASAGIFGILVAAALIAPNMQVRLLIPPVTLTVRQLALILLLIGAFVVVTGGRNAGGEAGHLGGALAGFLLLKIPALRHIVDLLSHARVKVVRRGGPRPERVARIQQPKKQRYEKKLKPKSRVSRADASEVDRILDKINEHGLQSLTEEERHLLTRAGRK